VITRRGFSAILAATLVQARLGAETPSAPPTRFRAVAFDAFVIFNPKNVVALAESLFPGKGNALLDEWRARQFDYAWLRVVSHTYADFWKVTEDALLFSTEKLKLDLTAHDRSKLLNTYLEMPLWSDVPQPLSKLKAANLKLALLSNFSAMMLERNLVHAGIQNLFEYSISTDQARTYKPDPRAYDLGVKTFKLRRDEVLFVAFGGWDAWGAKEYGYTTFWVNRAGQPAERLQSAPDGAGPDLSSMLGFLSLD
jgi:2-haloacid dehalogenase